MRKMSQLAWICLLAIFGTVAQSHAGTISYLGTTFSGPLWNRPNAGNPPVSPLSGIGTAVPFSVQPFSVSQSGLYDFMSLSVAPTAWDNNLYLYRTSFNPLSPLTNAIIGNDDFPDIGMSGFSGVSLAPSTNYLLVTTGFTNTSFGSFSNTVTGPGSIILPGSASVPEPTSIVIYGLGACIAFVRHRRRAAII